MALFIAGLLGVVQGLTEFLPISSSAHLIVVPWLLGWESEGIVFDVSLHVGTAVAILAYFWRDWVDLVSEAIRGILAGRPLGNQTRKMAWYLVVGTLPAGIIGLLFENEIETRLRSPLVTVATLALLGGALYLSERVSRRDRRLEDFGWGDSIWIGLSQAVALIPGVSRSGITITVAMLRNADRAAAARFSFLLATPVIVGAGLREGWKLAKATHLPPAVAEALLGNGRVDWAVLAVGVTCAAVTGFLCIRYFLRYLQTRTFVPFVIYRFILAAVVLIFHLRTTAIG